MARRVVWLAGVLVACAEGQVPPVDEERPDPFPAPDAWGGTAGPGAPRVAFDDDQLFQACAHLQGDPLRTADHHNHVVVYDGWVVMPWAPEDGVQRLDWEACGLDAPPTPEDPAGVEGCPGVFGGGLTFWDLSDPCDPVKVGEGWTPWMRESHTVAFSQVDGRVYAAVDFLAHDGSGGVGFWDVTDPTAPAWVSQVRVPGHHYPDSYTRLTLSVTWQHPWVYASTASTGVHVVDASDPLAPEVVATIKPAPQLVGSFHVWGNRALSSSAGLARTVLVDLSDPLAAAPVFAGQFDTQDPDGVEAAYYFANLGARWGLFALSTGGRGGVMVYDLTSPDGPVLVGGHAHDQGEGGYVFQHEDRLFVGESGFGTVYDFTDPAAPAPLGTFHLQGDLDTVTPLGNVAIVSVDEKAAPGQASAVVPWRAAPDTRGPVPGMTSPVDGEEGVARSSRIGVVFDELLEPVSAFPGSFRVADGDGRPVPGAFNVAENVVNFSPSAPLAPRTTYTVTIPAGGLVDVSGNPVAETRAFTFTTGDE